MAFEITVRELNSNRTAYVSLPANRNEINDILDKEHIFGETKLRINCCDEVPELDGFEFDSKPTLDELNFLAKRIDEISAETYFQIAYRALLHKPFSTIKEAINRTYNLELVSVYPCSDLSEYGKIVLDNSWLNELNNVPNEIYELLDPEKIGRLMTEREDGVFIDKYYAVRDSYEPVIMYDDKLPERMDDWVFRLEITGTPSKNEDVFDKDFKVITLPTDEESLQKLAEQLGEKRIEDCVWLEMLSVIPGINDEIVFSPENIRQLNNIARSFNEFSRENAAKFKAVLWREQPNDLDGIEDILNALDQYEADVSINYCSEFGSKYLSEMLPPDFDRTLLDGACTGEFAKKILCANNCTFNEYGVVSERGGHLYALIEAPQQEQNSDFNMGGIS